MTVFIERLIKYCAFLKIHVFTCTYLCWTLYCIISFHIHSYPDVRIYGRERLISPEVMACASNVFLSNVQKIRYLYLSHPNGLICKESMELESCPVRKMRTSIRADQFIMHWLTASVMISRIIRLGLESSFTQRALKSSRTINNRRR